MVERRLLTGAKTEPKSNFKYLAGTLQKHQLHATFLQRCESSWEMTEPVPKIHAYLAMENSTQPCRTSEYLSNCPFLGLEPSEPSTPIPCTSRNLAKPLHSAGTAGTSRTTSESTGPCQSRSNKDQFLKHLPPTLKRSSPPSPHPQLPETQGAMQCPVPLECLAVSLLPCQERHTVCHERATQRHAEEHED